MFGSATLLITDYISLLTVTDECFSGSQFTKLARRNANGARYVAGIDSLRECMVSIWNVPEPNSRGLLPV